MIVNGKRNIGEDGAEYKKKCNLMETIWTINAE